MHRADHDDDPSPPRSRSASRRNSASLSRRSSIKKDKELKGISSSPTSATSTPKKVAKVQNLEFIVTGKQLLKRSDRANSLPGSSRRPSTDHTIKTRRPVETKRINERMTTSQSSKSQETSLEDDMSLDLSQVSDFEDTNSKYGIKKFQALATSTPKSVRGKSRTASLQNQIHSQRVENRRALNSAKDSLSYSRDSFKTSSTNSTYRHGTELDYSSVSPEYSGQSSTELSPRANQLEQLVSPRSQDMPVSSCCVSTWADCSEVDTKVEHKADGEWSSFWANYNNSLSKVPMKNYYDQCPTPYRTETLDLADFGDLDLSDATRIRSPDNMDALNHIIRNQGLHLTPRETQNIIKCAHLLGNVLSKAIERRTKPTEIEDAEAIIKKRTMTLDLKETVIPLEVKEEKKSETVTTQTDISLPNTKSAPRIFENILRQLSRSSIDVSKVDIKDKTNENKDKIDKPKDEGTKKDNIEANKNKTEKNKDVSNKELSAVKDKEEIQKAETDGVRNEGEIKKTDNDTENDGIDKGNSEVIETNAQETQNQTTEMTD